MIKKTVGSTVTVLMYDEAGHLLGEYTSGGVLIQETIWMGDIPVATLRPNGSTACTSTICIFYVHTDQLNAPRKISQPTTGTLAWRWDTDPFGTATPNQNPGKLGTFKYNLRFPGQYYQAETGLNYNYFRDYDPQTGRYIESDPIGLASGTNPYAYVGGNPVSFIDRLGLDISYANHVVAGEILHSLLIITPENQAPYENDPRFQNIDANGNRYATIGAGPNLWDELEAGIDRPHDVHDPVAFRKRLTIPCQYKDEDAAIQQLFQLTNNYNHHQVGYTLFPLQIFGIPIGFNSNSFISGLGQAAGFTLPPVGGTGGNTPGYQNPIYPENYGAP